MTSAVYSYNNIIDKPAPPRAKELLDVELRTLVDDGGSAGGTTALSDDVLPRRREVPEITAAGLDAWIIDDLLSPAECRALIHRCNELKWTFWQSSDGTAAADVEDASTAKAFRSADTIEVDLPRFTEDMWRRRLAPFFENTVITFDAEADPDNFERDCEGVWLPDGFARNALFARYLKGGHFAPHVDGTSVQDFNHRTMYTMLIYLNDCAEGGETRVLAGEQCASLTTDATGKVFGNGLHKVYDMKPTQGSAIVFRYNVLHEGMSVAEGSAKYIFRGDIMFSRRPSLYDSDADRAAFEAYQRARVTEANGDAHGAVALFRQVRKLSPQLAAIYGL